MTRGDGQRSAARRPLLVGGAVAIAIAVWLAFVLNATRDNLRIDVPAIYAELGGMRLVCEVELGPGRVLNDVRKAEARGADLLLIVTPTATEARSIRRRLRTFPRSRVRVRVRPMGLAITDLSQMSPVECRRDTGSETRQPAGEGER